ncbi:RNA transcription, translation and transport factor protein [Agrilus planipennis]|uniref:RNA transcription, translation and transport factor protein n=1 Tax=Agrilus planipennis TaxID=224129 RepID=A0A7F5R633_AGRPL|nr:RNA transcription, translation and transport factor protein [Agrilus planipennis]
MYKRKLSALNYPQPETVNVKDEKEFRKIIVWLEDKKIKMYKPENRKNLSDISASDWGKIYQKYKDDVNCQVSNNIADEELDWFLGLALKTEYLENKEKYGKHTVKNIKSKKIPNVVADNPLDHLDFSSKEFSDGIKTIAQMLNCPIHPDSLITLQALSKIICNRLNREALQKPELVVIKGTPFPFQDTNLGFDLGDAVLNKAVKVLRLLYIHDLRDLQTKANELIVGVQSITANPKTDTALGKVGV